MPAGLPSSILVADVENPDCNAIMKMYDRYLGIILFTVFVIESRGQIGQFVALQAGKECPATSAEWKKLANARNCPGNAPYHCVANQHREFGEVCVKESWVQPGFCPEYNTEAKKINVKRCQPFDGYICSTDAFQSHETYSREICLRTPKPTTTTAVPLVTTTTAPSSSPVGAIVAVVIILILVAVAVGVWFLLRRRCNFSIPVPFTKRRITICAKPEESIKDPELESLVEGISKEMEKEIQRCNPFFVETRIYRDIISMLENHKVVLVVGKTGIGKSATCVGVLEYYRDRLEWKTKHLPTETVDKLEERTIVLVDITFGDISLYIHYDPNIDTMLNRLYTLTRDCREFKILITSSSPISPENKIPILKGCAEFNFDNIQYEKEELKKMYKTYTNRNFNTENETDGNQDSKQQTSESVMSDHDEQQNRIKEELLEVKAVKDISTDFQTDIGNSSQNLSNSLRFRQSERSDSDARNIKPVVDESAEENGQKEENISTDVKNQEEKSDDVRSVPGKEETEATETSETTPYETNTEKYHLPIQEIGDVNQSKNDTAISMSDVSVELQSQTQMTDEGNNAKENQREFEDEIWKKTNISEFGLPAVCYLSHDFQEDVESCKAIDVMSYLDSYISSLAESSNKWEKQRYSTLVYMMLNGSTISSGFIIKQLLGEIDPSLDSERLLVYATEMVDEGMLQKRGKEHLFSNAAQIPKSLSTCPTKSVKDGMMRVTESVFSFSNDIILFVVIKSYITHNFQMFARYGYLPFIMQFLQPKEQPDRLSVQLRGDTVFVIELGTVFAKRNTSENELKDLAILNKFKSRLYFHEEATMKYYGIDKDKEDDRKGNVFVRKMINHHPYLKEYYTYAEPEKFRSIPKGGFKQEVNKHPACCKSQTPDDF